jgi:hypothetical protein
MDVPRIEVRRLVRCWRGQWAFDRYQPPLLEIGQFPNAKLRTLRKPSSSHEIVCG